MDEQQQGEASITLSTARAQSSAAYELNDEERPFDSDNPDSIEDYEQHAEVAAMYQYDYPSKDIDGEDEYADFELVQPYKAFICGTWAAGRGRAIAFVTIAAYSLWAFVVDFQRAMPLFIVEMIVLGIVLTTKATEILVPEKKAALQDWTVEFCMETMVRGGFAAGRALSLIYF